MNYDPEKGVRRLLPDNMPPQIEERLIALNTALTASTRTIAELALMAHERNGLVRDNNELRAKLEEALEHLRVSRAQAMQLAEELEKYRKP